MPTTISHSDHRQIIGGVFSDRNNANRAIQEFRNLGIPDSHIQEVIQVNREQAESAYVDALVQRGFAESQAPYYDQAIREGKILVAIHNVTDPNAVIDIFDRNQAEFNPNGSRNVREDVLGLTTGTAVGAVAGGIAGAVLGGPVGAAAGAAAGALMGGAAGAAAGKSVEHHK